MANWSYLTVEKSNPGWSPEGDWQLAHFQNKNCNEQEMLQECGNREWELVSVTVTVSKTYYFKQPAGA